MTQKDHRRRFTREKIGTRLNLIAPMVHRRSATIAPFRLLQLDGPTLDAPICAEPDGWDEVPFESYWGGPDMDFVLKSSFTVPEGWDREHLALHLPLGVLGDIFNHPEALAYIDRTPVGSADRYHHSLPLAPELADGREHTLSLHGWTGHAGWPPDRTSRAKLFMGRCAVVERDPDTMAFVALARAALDAVSVVDKADGTVDALLSALDEAFLMLDTRDPLGEAFYASVPGALGALRAGLAAAGAPLDTTLHAIGHAHMDIAYLWTIAQMRLKNARTYSNVLRLMDENPEFHFSHSQPALYEMAERDYPALFERIRARVAEGRWEVMGGMWVEPDLNVPGPEALVRQFTLGRSWFRDRFGDVETPVLWLPDTFGFPGQIPQLMQLAGLEWFITNKLNWNQVNRVPWATHIWEGIDGSQVKAHILTTPREVQYLPFPTNYKSDLSAREVMGTLTHAGATALPDLPICFGYGDGGGGPTEDLLARAGAYADMPGMPRVKMSTVREALEAMEARAGELPVWRGEHYLEGHRGVYTSQGWIKRANRRAERALHEAEALAAMAGQVVDLEEAWKLVCLNQFHDIVTGTSITEVFEDARRDYARVAELTEAEASRVAQALAGSEPVVANTAPTDGPRVAVVDEPGDVPGQDTGDGRLVYFGDLPGYAVTPLSSARLPEHPVSVLRDGDAVVLENEHLTARLDAGRLVSVTCRATGREIIAPGQEGNALLAFEDRPICWDAWDIDPHYEDREERIGPPLSVEVIEEGPIRATIRLTHEWRKSRIVQDVSLCAGSHRLDIANKVDWHETHVLLKAAFPVTVSAPRARFDIQWGMIERSTSRASDFDAARFEVPAQKWAELADDTLAVALMNDCKYGCDVSENVLRLTLIKSATAPDPVADQGRHVFTYALMVNPGGDVGRRNHAAYDLNTPLRVIPAGEGQGAAPRRVALASGAENVVIETVKPAWDGQGIVVRLFECSGRAVETALQLDRPCNVAEIVDLFETTLEPLAPERATVPVSLAPYQVLSVRLRV